MPDMGAWQGQLPKHLGADPIQHPQHPKLLPAASRSTFGGYSPIRMPRAQPGREEERRYRHAAFPRTQGSSEVTAATAQKLAVVLTWKHPGPAIMNPQLQAGMGLAVWDSGRSQGARWNNGKGPGMSAALAVRTAVCRVILAAC